MLSPLYLVALALAASGISILSVVYATYDIYSDLNLLAANIEGELHEFKGSTNEAWEELMTIQWKMETIDHITTTKRRSIVERDVFVNKKGVHKIKTRQNVFLQQRLPSWCVCEPLRPVCPPGARGPRGEPGQPGSPGDRGRPGDNNYETIRPPVCDLRHTGCVRCPSGPPGVRGPIGAIGRPGSMGETGPPAENGGAGLRGPPGPRGDAGAPGRSGFPGKQGAPGKGNVVVVSKRGPAGLPGDGGLRGPPGRPGANGRSGIPGAQGPPGLMGFMGQRGEPGLPGFPGRRGDFARDAGYCPCPKRSVLMGKTVQK